VTTTPAAPVGWPPGKRAAACFTFDVDAESAVLGINTAHADRMSVMSHQAYGPLVGVPRLLAMLTRHDVRSTFFVPGYTALRYPDVSAPSSTPVMKWPITAICTRC
jgi:peptidoglycan-N-acetylglucosamine deacetylase